MVKHTVIFINIPNNIVPIDVKIPESSFGYALITFGIGKDVHNGMGVIVFSSC